MAAARPHEPPWREPTLEVERILMVDFTATQARAKGVTPSANHEGGGADRGHCGQNSKCFTSTLRQRGGQDAPPTSRDPHNCRYATSRVRLLVPI
jgi:hypothetical protein